MKNVIAIAAAGFIFALPMAQADQSHHPEQAPAGQAASQGGMGMMDMEQMQKRMQEMQALMGQADKTADPKERQRLLQEHMTKMHEMMSDMRGMMGPDMMGKGMMAQGMMMGGGMKGQDKPSGMDMEQRQQMMEKRMDMMQGMMEQMMEQMMQQQRDGMGMNK